MNEKSKLRIILICSLLAVFVSSYLLSLHLSDSGSICDINNQFSCDIVNKSIYSEILSIPISLLSLIFFYIVSIAIIFVLKGKRFLNLEKNTLMKALFYMMFLSLIFSLYLVYIEVFVLFSFCLLCLVLDILIIVIFLISYTLFQR